MIPDEFSLGGAVLGVALSFAPGGLTAWAAVGGADPVARARVARLGSGGARGVLVLVALVAGFGAWLIGGAAAAWITLPAGLAAVAVLLAWVESFDDATFEAEREAAAREEEPEAPASALGGGDIRMMALVGAFLGPGP